jgi:hypothetical protein
MWQRKNEETISCSFAFHVRQLLRPLRLAGSIHPPGVHSFRGSVLQLLFDRSVWYLIYQWNEELKSLIMQFACHSV